MKVYLSHKISGGHADISNVEMQENCDKAVLIANLIRNAIPSLEVYVPGEQTEQFVHIARAKKYLTIGQILDVDCCIIDSCDIVIVYVPEGDELQSGRLVEYDYAIAHNKPVKIFDSVEQVINYLAGYILRV